MKNLITKDYVSQIQFYQMPKAFFQNPNYMAMRIESRVAYMLLLDLLPLSIKNNWVNKKDQVFVKLSRTKLMALLNIKGTQKIAQVMKELVDYKLIVNKKIGLTKCNEIYLYPIDAPSLKKKGPSPENIPTAEACPRSKGHEAQEIALPKITAAKKPLEVRPKHTRDQEAPQANIAQSVVKPATLEDDQSEVQDLLKNQIHIEDLKQRYNPDFVDEICNNICEMFTSTSTRIGKQDKPMHIIQAAIRKLKMYHIEHVIDQFMEVSAKTVVFNPKRYIQSMIYNSIFEASSRMAGHIRYHFGYSC